MNQWDLFSPFFFVKQMRTRYEALFISLEVMKKLNNVNEQNSQIIPYNKFYINDLKDRVNLKGDYVQWVQQQVQNQFSTGVSYYLFLIFSLYSQSMKND